VTDNNRLIDYAHSQAHMQTSAQEKGALQSERIDFLSHLVKAEDKKTGRRPTLPYLGTESLNMINAGADPFSSVLAGAIFYFVHNPETLRKATAEVRCVSLPMYWHILLTLLVLFSLRPPKSLAAQH
jgi:cytochrome P450